MNIGIDTVLRFGALIPAFILHELAHAWTANRLGDDTARKAGRLTLNPMVHIDPFGSLILPALGAFTGFPVLAWAKPVPVNQWKLRHPRRDMLLVSIAGPVANLIMLAGAAIVTRSLLRDVVGSLGDASVVVRFCFWFGFVNLLLGVFNLLPIPPLDGAAVLERALPTEARIRYRQLAPYGLFVLMLLAFSTSFLARLFDPFIEGYAHFLGLEVA